MESKATPRPWSYSLSAEQGKRGGDRNTLFLFLSAQPSVKFINLPPTPEMKANAELIVTAVNAHDDLEAAVATLQASNERLTKERDALRDSLKVLNEHMEDYLRGKIWSIDYKGIREAVNAARAALKLVEE